MAITKAIQQDIGSIPRGGDSDITVVMRPVVDTSLWDVECAFYTNREDTTAVLTLTSGTGEVTVGLGDDNEKVRANITNAMKTYLTGRLWYVFRKTNSATRDRIAFGTVKFDGPEA